MSEVSAAPAAVEAPSTEAPTTESTAQPVATPQPVNKKKFTYKSDGQEFNEELDDSEITSRLAHARSANKRMSEAAASKKQVESFVKALKEDPMSVLSNDQIMGNAKFQEIAEAFLAKKLEEQLLTPEERQQKEQQEKLKKYEAKEKEELTAREQAQAKQLEDHYTQEYQKTIIEGLTDSGLPKNAFTVKRMAQLMQTNLQHGLELSPKDLARLVREDMQSEFKSVISDANAEQMLAMLGDDVANKIRKHDLSKFQVKNPVNKPISQQDKASTKMSSRDWNEKMKNKFR